MAQIPTLNPQGGQLIQAPQGVSDAVMQTSNALLGSQMQLVNTAVGKASGAASAADSKSIQIYEQRIELDQTMRLLQADNALGKAFDLAVKDLDERAMKTGQMPDQREYDRVFNDLYKKHLGGLDQEHQVKLFSQLSNYQDRFRDTYFAQEKQVLMNNLNNTLEDSWNDNLKQITRIDRPATSKDLEQALFQQSKTLDLAGISGAKKQELLNKYRQEGSKSLLEQVFNTTVATETANSVILDPETNTLYSPNIEAFKSLLKQGFEGASPQDIMTMTNKLLDKEYEISKDYYQKVEKAKEQAIGEALVVAGQANPNSKETKKTIDTWFEQKYVPANKYEDFTNFTTSDQYLAYAKRMVSTEFGSKITVLPERFTAKLMSGLYSSDDTLLTETLNSIIAFQSDDKLKQLYNNSVGAEARLKADAVISLGAAGVGYREALQYIDENLANPNKASATEKTFLEEGGRSRLKDILVDATDTVGIDFLSPLYGEEISPDSDMFKPAEEAWKYTMQATGSKSSADEAAEKAISTYVKSYTDIKRDYGNRNERIVLTDVNINQKELDAQIQSFVTLNKEDMDLGGVEVGSQSYIRDIGEVVKRGLTPLNPFGKPTNEQIDRFMNPITTTIKDANAKKSNLLANLSLVAMPAPKGYWQGQILYGLQKPNGDWVTRKSTGDKISFIYKPSDQDLAKSQSAQYPTVEEPTRGTLASITVQNKQ